MDHFQWKRDLRSNTYLEDGAELADDVHASHAEVLAERDLQEEERDAAREQGQEVGDQEGPWKESRKVFNGLIEPSAAVLIDGNLSYIS